MRAEEVHLRWALGLMVRAWVPEEYERDVPITTTSMRYERAAAALGMRGGVEICHPAPPVRPEHSLHIGILHTESSLPVVNSNGWTSFAMSSTLAMSAQLAAAHRHRRPYAMAHTMRKGYIATAGDVWVMWAPAHFVTVQVTTLLWVEL